MPIGPSPYTRAVIPGVDLEQLLLTIGLVGLAAIIFAESGLFFGFFLPGDSLLITAGVLAAARPDTFPVALVIAVAFVAAVTGDAVGYTFGRRVGRRLYDRPDTRFFRRSHLLAAERFYEHHGGKTSVVARFMPFVRTLAPIVAGTAQMHYRRFATYNFTGAFLWVVGLVLAGYILAEVLGRDARPLAAGHPGRGRACERAAHSRPSPASQPGRD